jgi:outer membrane protein OmpA-like peptidoglycan-associated protein
MKLSQQRAEAVVRELASKYKVAADRLKSGGVGPLAPVASNDTEDGKARTGVSNWSNSKM